jgi:2-amino-4-hydroxy-6-hydroxymethyldihydropteridine diphosphokinase
MRFVIGQFVFGKGCECAKGDVCLLLEKRTRTRRSDICAAADVAYRMAMLILVGIGSNRGDSIGIVRESIERLRSFAKSGFRTSSLWRTSPVDCPPGSADFINAVVAFEPRDGLTPEAMLAALKQLEREFGRSAALVRNAPRELDLDLLVYGDEARTSAEFTLPHPRATERRFVMAPAAEIVADLRWPGTRLTVAELLAHIDDKEIVERVPDRPNTAALISSAR